MTSKKTRPKPSRKRRNQSPPKIAAKNRGRFLPALLFLVLILVSLVLIHPAGKNFSQRLGKILTSLPARNQQKTDRNLNDPEKKELSSPPKPSAPTLISVYRLSKDYNQVRHLTFNRQEPEPKAAIAGQLFHLLTDPGLAGLAPIAPEVKLLGVRFISSTIFLDLSRELLTSSMALGAQDERLTILCLGNSFLETFPEYQNLQVLVEGEKVQTLAGHIDISQPISYQQIGNKTKL